MWKLLVERLDARSTIISILSTAMVLSLLSSLSIQAGRADALIATTAQETHPLQVGERAPSFVVETVDSEPFVFDPRRLNRPAIIVSFRGGWCPYCNMHLSELRTVLPEINALGIDVLFLSGDRPETLYRSLSADTQETIDGLDYRIYSDADAQAAIAFGIAYRIDDTMISRRHDKGQDIEESSMRRHGVLPVPAVYAIDGSGMITFAFAEPNYKVRLPADELLAAARGLVQ